MCRQPNHLAPNLRVTDLWMTEQRPIFLASPVHTSDSYVSKVAGLCFAGSVQRLSAIVSEIWSIGLFRKEPAPLLNSPTDRRTSGVGIVG